MCKDNQGFYGNQETKTYYVKVPVRAIATVTVVVKNGESINTKDIINQAIKDVRLHHIDEFEGVEILPTTGLKYWNKATIIREE